MGIDFKDNLAILHFLWVKMSQLLADSDCTFKFDQGTGHIEFYQFGPSNIAVVIYNLRTMTRLELLTIENSMSEAEVENAVKEMVLMIRRKRLKIMGPVTRRIKLDS